MKIKTKIYKDISGDGKLHFVGKGECVAYEPEIKGKSSVVGPHITLSFGDYRLHLDKVDFMKFCGKLFDRNGARHVSLLRSSK